MEPVLMLQIFYDVGMWTQFAVQLHIIDPVSGTCPGFIFYDVRSVTIENKLWYWYNKDHGDDNDDDDDDHDDDDGDDDDDDDDDGYDVK